MRRARLVRFERRLHDAHERVHDVVGERKIAPQLSLTEDGNLLALENRVGEEPVRHVGTAHRSIDREEP